MLVAMRDLILREHVIAEPCGRGDYGGVFEEGNGVCGESGACG